MFCRKLLFLRLNDEETGKESKPIVAWSAPYVNGKPHKNDWKIHFIVNLQ